MFIRTKFHINRLTQTYFTAFLYVLSDHPSYGLDKKLDLYAPDLLYKIGVQGGILFMDTFS